jgi:hypothetical protein
MKIVAEVDQELLAARLEDHAVVVGELWRMAGELLCRVGAVPLLSRDSSPRLTLPVVRQNSIAITMRTVGGRAGSMAPSPYDR